jgi:uncharacterized protein YuzE
MAEKVKVWFDPEGDFLELRFSDAPGHMRETEHEALMERVDEHGQVVGFSILASRHRKRCVRKDAGWEGHQRLVALEP